MYAKAIILLEGRYVGMRFGVVVLGCDGSKWDLLGGEMEKYGLINIACRLIYMRRSFFLSRSLGLILGCKDTLSLESSASWCHHHLHHIEPPSLFYSYR
jgi:hypothetical protein